jgi:hypothetical protein
MSEASWDAARSMAPPPPAYSRRAAPAAPSYTPPAAPRAPGGAPPPARPARITVDDFASEEPTGRIAREQANEMAEEKVAAPTQAKLEAAPEPEPVRKRSTTLAGTSAPMTPAPKPSLAQVQPELRAVVEDKPDLAPAKAKRPRVVWAVMIAVLALLALLLWWLAA